MRHPDGKPPQCIKSWSRVQRWLSSKIPILERVSQRSPSLAEVLILSIAVGTLFWAVFFYVTHTIPARVPERSARIMGIDYDPAVYRDKVLYR